MTSNNKYTILSKVDFPQDLKQLSFPELEQLCQEIRSYIIETIGKTGGHLAPSLGTVELTVAIHYVFDTPRDKIVWDVGHQAYGHKVITGRREQLKTIRQLGGISGFCKRSESEYDAFGAGHASTSISAAVGYAAARGLTKEYYRTVALIGDGAFTGGLAYEGLNNVCNINGQFLVVLNDNEMSISPNVGAMSNHFMRIVRSPKYIYYKNRIWETLSYLPRGTNFFRQLGHKFMKPIKRFFAPSVVFEEFGLRYFGPIDGHDLEELIFTFKNIKDLKYPVLLHVKTIKGKGLTVAEEDPTKYHGISPEKVAGKDEAVDIPPQAPPFLNAFGHIACEIAAQNKKAVFINAAMKEGTGLVEYADKYPDRYFDVGIAEGHAVTFSAGLAAAGFRPVAVIYSTFLQRAYDNIIHDVALQNLPVIFALDRGGLVGADGPTHHGVYDVSYLNTIPNMIIAAPRNGNELRDLLYTAFSQDQNPFAVRYPKDSCVEFDRNLSPQPLKIGTWQELSQGKKVALIGIGVLSNTALEVKELLKPEKINPTVIHARFLKPFDEKMIKRVAEEHDLLVTLEDNALQGGFGMCLNNYIKQHQMDCKTLNLGIPDKFIEHGTRQQLLQLVGLDAQSIAAQILSTLQ